MKKLNIISAAIYTSAALLFFSGGSPVIIITMFVLSLLVTFGQEVKGAFFTVVTNPLIGKSKQSTGNITFSNWKGIRVMKDKVTSIANPKTDKQLTQRSAMTQIVAMFRNISGAVMVGFKKLAVKQSEFNAFTSYNLKNAFDLSSPPAATLNYADILVSKGTITQAAITTAVADDSLNTLVVTYPSTAALPGQSTTDNAIIVAFNETHPNWIIDVTGATRNDGSGTLTLPTTWVAGDIIHVYLGFYNQVSGESSDSDYLQITEVA